MPEKMPVPQQSDFDRAIDEYLAWLRENPEELMEAPPQAQQRKIFVESFDLISAANPCVHAFNELLVQWRKRKTKEIRQVVPDNMVVVHDGELDVPRSWNVPDQPVKPFWVFEYVSKGTEKKDFEFSHDKCEKELKVPYYLTFYPDNQEMTLLRHNGRRYVTVVPSDQGRCPVPEIDVEVGLLDGWVRFWHCGRLLPLPAELQRELSEARRKLDEANRERDEARRECDEARRERDEARCHADRMQEEMDRIREEMARLRAEQSGP